MTDTFDAHGAEINLFGTGYENYGACDTTWQGCGDAPANLTVWPDDLLADTLKAMLRVN